MLVVTGFMIALAVVLSKLVSINISFLRIGFGFPPIAVLAILYGPYVAAIGYGIADLLGAWLFPTGTFFPGFTVSAVLTGLIFGWVLYNKEVTFVRALIASALVCLIVNLLINTYWLTFIIGRNCLDGTLRTTKNIFRKGIKQCYYNYNYCSKKHKKRLPKKLFPFLRLPDDTHFVISDIVFYKFRPEPSNCSNTFFNPTSCSRDAVNS